MAIGIITDIGQLGLWIQAVGLAVIIWLVVQGVTLYFNRKRRKLLERIDIRLEVIEGKIDKLGKK